jgi:hypothetical protein
LQGGSANNESISKVFEVLPKVIEEFCRSKEEASNAIEEPEILMKPALPIDWSGLNTLMKHLCH